MALTQVSGIDPLEPIANGGSQAVAQVSEPNCDRLAAGRRELEKNFPSPPWE
jgi:hypothetical protein